MRFVDIEKFIARRKQLGYSQFSLSQGICTQSTLSKFENRKQTPALPILERLCDRLDLTIAELNEDDPTSINFASHKLDQIEENLMVENYNDAIINLQQIDYQKLRSNQGRLQYCYLKGMFLAVSNTNDAEAELYFRRILTELDPKQSTMFTQLSYLGLGIVADHQHDDETATLMFNKVQLYVATSLTEGIADFRTKQIFRLLTLMFYLATYLAEHDRLDQSNKLLDEELDVSSQRHVTYYVTRAKFLQAQNSWKLNHDIVKLKSLLSETLIFAKFNRNQVVPKQVAKLLRKLEKKNKVKQKS